MVQRHLAERNAATVVKEFDAFFTFLIGAVSCDRRRRRHLRAQLLLQRHHRLQGRRYDRHRQVDLQPMSLSLSCRDLMAERS